MKNLSPSHFARETEETIINKVVKYAVTSEYRFYCVGFAMKFPYSVSFSILMRTHDEMKRSSLQLLFSDFLTEAGTRLLRVARNMYFR